MPLRQWHVSQCQASNMPTDAACGEPAFGRLHWVPSLFFLPAYCYILYVTCGALAIYLKRLRLRRQ